MLLLGYKIGKHKIRSYSGFVIFTVFPFVSGKTAEYKSPTHHFSCFHVILRLEIAS